MNVIVVKDGEWNTVRKAPNEAGSTIKDVSMIYGKYDNGAHYEIIYKDRTSKLFKFA